MDFLFFISILVNGVSSGFFDGSKGLLLGDPLSPLLCVPIIGSLHKIGFKGN